MTETTRASSPPGSTGAPATSGTSGRARLRERAFQLSGNAVGRVLGLPRPTTRYTVSRVRVPMRDGVQLVADHYAPRTTNPVGTLLVRGPYGRGFPFSLVFCRTYAARGYHVVMQSVRGTFGSEGAFEPMVNEAADATDTVAWLREQPWFTGRFGTVGLSYLGFTQWALLNDPPPELAAAVITVGPNDFWEAVWDTGSFTNEFLSWSDMIAHQEDPSRLKSALRQVRNVQRLTQAVAEAPLGESARKMLGTGAPWFESWLERPDPADAFWDRVRFPAALDRVDIPVLLMGGWQDIFLRQTLRHYRHLRDRGVDVALTVGPWTHTQMGTKGLGTVWEESLDWLDAHVGRTGAPSRPSPVRVFVNGQGWRNLPDWPPATSEHAFYLQPGGRIGEDAPREAPPVTFRYDPTRPTRTVGGPLLDPNGGYRDDSKLATRDGVLAFSGSPLAHDLTIHGRSVIELSHGADNANVDLFVRISEVNPKGRSRNVTEGYLRLEGVEKSGQTVTVELDAVAHRFKAGSRIRVLMAGSWFPRYALNPGTGEPTLTARELKPATHWVYFGPSRLLLPVGPS